MIALYLSKQKISDADPEAIQQIKFTEKRDRTGYRTMFFILEELKETNLDVLQGTILSYSQLFWFNIIPI